MNSRERDAEQLREEIRRILQLWQRGAVDVQRVQAKAEQLLETWNYPTYEESDPRSIPIDVLSNLDMAYYQLVVPQDIPAMLRFLDTPPGQEANAWKHWKQYWNDIDYDDRKRRLRTDEFYAT